MKPLAGRVGDVADGDVELRGAPLRGVVTERQVTDDSVPLACEAEGERLGDIQRSVGMNYEKRIEVADADRAALRARIKGERAERNEEYEGPTNR